MTPIVFGVFMLDLAGLLGWASYTTATGHSTWYGVLWTALLAIGSLGAVCIAAGALLGREERR